MTRAHGTHVKYVVDKCRCEQCRTANREYERARARRVEPAYVTAGPARAHCRELMAAGVGWKRIAEVSGVSTGGVWKLVYGKNGKPSKRIRRSTEQKILAVTPAARAGGAMVDAAPTWKLIDEMVAAGVPKTRINEQLGNKGAGLQLSRQSVMAANARKIADIHARWKSGDLVLHRDHRRTGPRPIAAPATRPVERGTADVSDLYDALAEIVEERHEQAVWRQHAACRGRAQYLWFPARGDQATLDAGLKICGACLVRDQCRAANIDKREGTYGGLTAYVRRRLRQEDAA